MFWIAVDDDGELWLSSDDHPENKVLVCFATGPTGLREWTKFPEQELTLISLVSGEAHYFEVRPCILLVVLHFVSNLYTVSSIICQSRLS